MIKQILSITLLISNCGGGGLKSLELNSTGALSNSAEVLSENVLELSLQCLTASDVELSVKTSSIDRAAALCSLELNKKLAVHDIILTSDQQRAVLAMMISYRYAPYGRSNAVRMLDLQQASVLDCDNYGALVMHLLESTPSLLIGFEGGAIGNHAQVLVTPQDGQGRYGSKPLGSMILDPTVNVLGFNDYNGLMSGNRANLVLAFQIEKNRTNKVDLQVNKIFRSRVIRALSQGLYRPMDALYYVEGIEGLARIGSSSNWPTPGAARLRKRPQKRNQSNKN